MKIATPLMSMIPVAGGLLQNITQGAVDAHAAKKAQKEYDSQVAQQQQNQIAQQTAQALAQATTQTLGDALVQGTFDGMSNSAKLTTAKYGATVADMTISQWFKEHWLAVSLGVTAFFGAIWMLTKSHSSGARRRR
ncbi:hypothetical protein [Flavobacterium marginilacus]|uniref:hypothetical protein n=1 Tax=Flavobacterium marginilacus TaxID=3003256 RepID=UPI00248DA68C|nr:hypothetical protein [Flavobacterium marginilacus]